MLTLYNFLPRYYLACGTLARLYRVDNPMVDRFKFLHGGDFYIQVIAHDGLYDVNIERFTIARLNYP